MVKISDASKLYVGSSLASKAYVGTNLVWPVGDDAATTAWVAAVVTAGGTVGTTRKTVVNNLIVGLKADGVWAKLDRLYLLAAENNQSARIDLVALAQATVATGAPTFAVDIGYTVNNTNYMNMNYNPTVDAIHFSTSSCHMGAWNLFNGTSTEQLLVDSPPTSIMLFPKYTDNNIYTRINDTAGGGVAIGDPRGLIAGDRGSGADRNTYQNGALLGNVFATVAATHNSSTFLYSGGPCAAVSFGGSLTSANHLALYNRLRTYMTAVGIP